MLAARLSQRVARTLRTGARRMHTAATGTQAGARGLRYAVAAAASAAVGAVLLAAHNTNTAECQQKVAAATAASSEEVKYYEPTFSRRAQLPANAAEISASTHAELAAIYDPAASTSVVQPLAHALLWGGSPLPDGLAPLELLFTAEDPDGMHRHMELLVRTIQDRICNDLLDIEQMSTSTLTTLDGVPTTPKMREVLLSQSEEPGRFRQDIIVRPGGTGGGVTRVLSGGRVFAKAGVSVSVANVKPPPAALKRLEGDHPRLKGLNPTEPYSQFTAAVSLVLHPVSPHVPTAHANFRIFDLIMPDGKRTWWIGGGSDLTPTYVVDEDAEHFHRTLKNALQPLNPSYYKDWKKWADDYFYIKHRNETRGVGGVFFDDLHTESLEHYERVIRRMGETFSSQYFPIVLKRKDQPFNESELGFQQLRRGRYIEYNLVYDKGTTYGLNMVNSRPDAVLMSLPPISRFAYKQPFETDREAYTKEVLTKPKEWC